MASWTEDIHGNIISEKKTTMKQSNRKHLDKNKSAIDPLEALKKDIRDEVEREKVPKKVKKLQKKVKKSTQNILQQTEKTSLKKSIQTELWKFRDTLFIRNHTHTATTIDLTEFNKHINKLGKESIMAMMLFGNSYDDKKWPIIIKNSMSFDARGNLRDAWEKKIQLYGRENPSLKKYYHETVLPYIEWNKRMSPISRKDWDDQIASTIQKVNKNLEIDKIFVKNPEKQETLKKLISLIGPAEMNSIIFAELIDSVNPTRNEVFFNTILENAGPEFLGLFPALWDPYLSFGPSQLTDFAVWDDGGIGLMQKKYMSKKFVPDDMRDITLSDHHEGWYIFTIFNLKELLENCSNSQVEALNTALIEHPEKTKNQLIQYIAAAHNKPTEARKQFRNWIDDELVGKEFRPYLKSATTKNNADKAGKNHKVQIALL